MYVALPSKDSGKTLLVRDSLIKYFIMSHSRNILMDDFRISSGVKQHLHLLEVAVVVQRRFVNATISPGSMQCVERSHTLSLNLQRFRGSGLEALDCRTRNETLEGLNND